MKGLLITVFIWALAFYVAKSLVPVDWHIVVGYGAGMINAAILFWGNDYV